MKTLAILVGGGPPPGINAVIAAAPVEARNRGLRALGCRDGFKWLMEGDLSRVHELDIGGLSQIHFEGGSILRTAARTPPGRRRRSSTSPNRLSRRLGPEQREALTRAAQLTEPEFVQRFGYVAADA